jgi:hypothetical protein
MSSSMQQLKNPSVCACMYVCMYAFGMYVKFHTAIEEPWYMCMYACTHVCMWVIYVKFHANLVYMYVCMWVVYVKFHAAIEEP